MLLRSAALAQPPRKISARVARAPGGLRADFRLFIGRRVATGSVTEALPVNLATGMAKALARVLNCAFDDTAVSI